MQLCVPLQHYPYTAATEACSRGSTKLCNDSCSEDCDQHHKNIRRIAIEANNLHQDNHLIILWSNSDLFVFCQEVDSVHTSVPGYATVVPDEVDGVTKRYPVVQILTMDKYDSLLLSDYGVDQEFLKVVLAHEVAHTLDLPDMYDLEGHKDNPNMFCIMQNPSFETIDDLCNSIANEGNAFCATCFATLHAAIPDDAYEHFTVSEN